MLTELPSLWILLTSCVVIAAGDILLLWGSRETNWEPGLAALAKSPRSFIIIGSMLGLFTIPWWFLVSPYMALIPGASGKIAYLSYCSYVAAVLAFHVSHGFVGLAVSQHPDLKAPLGRLMTPLPLLCFLSATIASIAIAIAYAGVKGAIDMVWYHYALLPTPAIALIQFGLGGALKRVPFFQILCGPVAMAAFFVAFTDLVRQNAAVLLAN